MQAKQAKGKEGNMIGIYIVCFAAFAIFWVTVYYTTRPKRNRNIW